MSASIRPNADGSAVIQVNAVDRIKINVDGGVNIGGPAFSATCNTGPSLAHATWTKMVCNLEDFDTTGAHDVATGRFQPTVAGYYNLGGVATFNVNATGIRLAALYKNGVEYRRGGTVLCNAADWAGASVSSLVYLNGSTDYVELFAFQNSGAAVGLTNAAGQMVNHFSGHLARAA